MQDQNAGPEPSGQPAPARGGKPASKRRSMTAGYNQLAVNGLVEYLQIRTRDPRPVTEAEVDMASRAADDIALPAEQAAALPLADGQSVPNLLRNFNVIAAGVALEVQVKLNRLDRLNQQYLDRAAEAMEDEVEERELAASTRVARR